MKQWPPQTELRKLVCAWCGLAVTPPWRDTGSELNCKWALIFFFPFPLVLWVDLLEVLKLDTPLAFVLATLSTFKWTLGGSQPTVHHTL